MAKTNTILKRPVNKLFTAKNKYHDTNQTDKATEQKLRRRAGVIGELKIKHEWQLRENWEGIGVFEHYKY